MGQALSSARSRASADPLPLSLPAPPPLPGSIRPEAAVPCVEAFDHPDWRFSVDWDGSRTLLFATPGAVRLQSERLVEVTDTFPELAAGADSLCTRALVLDGIVAILDPDGRPDLGALSRRLAVGASAPHTTPAVFLATDLLYVGGRPALAWPLDKRLATMREVTEGAEAIQVPDVVEGRGRALADAAHERGLSGLIARRADSPYHPGLASPDRLRIPLDERSTCVVAAVTHAASGERRGLLLAEHAEGRLAVAGWVPAPIEPTTAAWLDRLSATYAAVLPPLAAPAQGAAVRWLRPAITATVAHAGRHRDGTLRSASLIALRDDVDPAWCVRREPAPPPGADDALQGFVPTVLLPLPLDASTLELPRPR